MRGVGTAMAASIAATLGFAATACAQTAAPEVIACQGGAGVTPDQRIAGCTAIINTQAGAIVEKAYINRGNTYKSQGLNQSAIQDYDRAIRLKPDDKMPYFNRGTAYLKMRQFDDAIRDFDQVVRLNPNDLGGYFNRGYAYLGLGQYDRAIADIDQALRIQPDNAGAFDLRSDAYAGKGDYDHAIADLDQTIKLDPDFCACAYYTRGSIYLEKKHDLDRAIADFDEAIRRKPDYADSYTARGDAYDVKGLSDRALADYRDALKLRPGDKRAEDGVRRVLAKP